MVVKTLVQRQANPHAATIASNSHNGYVCDVTAPIYDRVARAYAEKFGDELSYKPFDCALLDQFANRVAERGSVCDLGCGPGQVVASLRSELAQALDQAQRGETVIIDRRGEPFELIRKGPQRSWPASAAKVRILDPATSRRGVGLDLVGRWQTPCFLGA